MKLSFAANWKQLICIQVVVALLIVACRSSGTSAETPGKDTTAMKSDTANIFEHMLVDNKKDPSCGMPVTAGIADTAHYKDKVLGFCSKECKDAFLKNPEANLAAADIKK